jgi:hypothetical protein
VHIAHYGRQVVAFQAGELLSKTIKTREAKRDIRALDKTEIAAERMKDSFVHTKDGAARTGRDEREYASPAEYAEDKITENADNAVSAPMRERSDINE